MESRVITTSLSEKINSAFDKAYAIYEPDGRKRDIAEYFFGIPTNNFSLILYLLGGCAIIPLKNTFKFIIEFIPKIIELSFLQVSEDCAEKNSIFSAFLYVMSLPFKITSIFARALISPTNSFKAAMETGYEVEDRYGKTLGNITRFVLGSLSALTSFAGFMFVGGLINYLATFAICYHNGPIDISDNGDELPSMSEFRHELVSGFFCPPNIPAIALCSVFGPFSICTSIAAFFTNCCITYKAHKESVNERNQSLTAGSLELTSHADLVRDVFLPTTDSHTPQSTAGLFQTLDVRSTASASTQPLEDKPITFNTSQVEPVTRIERVSPTLQRMM